MFKLILIDDEKFTLDILSDLINWNDFDFELCGSFTDPNEAIDFLINEHIDVVITDINMPKMSGIELTQKIRNILPDIKIVYLTAYSQFEYAKKAIEFNVSSYILKPIDADVLIDTLKKLSFELKNSMNFNKPETQGIILAKNIISDFFSKKGTSLPTDLYENLMKCDFQIDENSSCALIEIKIDNLDSYLNSIWKYGILRLYSSIDKLLTEEGLYIIPTRYSFDTIEVFVVEKCNSPKTFADLILSFENTFVANCTDVLQLGVQIKINDVFRRISNINIFDENEAFNKATMLFNAIKDGAQSQSKENNIFSGISMITDEEKKLVSEILILKFAQNCEGDALSEISIMLTELTKNNNSDIINENFKNIIQRIYSYFNTSANHDESIINSCKEFIKQNHTKNISLQDVADYVHLSAAHLSRLFKAITNQKYIDYLNEIRIGSAKSLLTFSDVKIKDISVQVGYGSYQYFLRVFKMYTGMTPVEYKNMYYKK